MGHEEIEKKVKKGDRDAENMTDKDILLYPSTKGVIYIKEARKEEGIINHKLLRCNNHNLLTLNNLHN